MPGLSASELTIVLFILLLVTVAGRLPRWGETLGSYLYKRAHPGQGHEAGQPTSQDGSSQPTTPGTGSPEQGPSSQMPPPS